MTAPSIIQGDRVAAAACFLPLSVNPLVSRDLGTRHRAAIGITEENDAVAIVVSEETGDHLAGDWWSHRARARRPTRCACVCARCSAAAGGATAAAAESRSSLA